MRVAANTRLLLFGVSIIVMASVAAFIIVSDAPVLVRAVAAVGAILFIGSVAAGIVTVRRSEK